MVVITSYAINDDEPAMAVVVVHWRGMDDTRECLVFLPALEHSNVDRAGGGGCTAGALSWSAPRRR